MRDDVASSHREERAAFSTEYFAQSIPCPFLKKESCSIHEDRPLICRQYLMTSEASHCKNPTTAPISRVALAADVMKALTRIETQ
jgi:Fe-S-cluster containining protein